MSTQASPVQQRSRLFVDRRLQGDIVKRILLHWLTFIAAGTALSMTLRFLTHPTDPLGRQLGDMVGEFGPYLVVLLALLPVFVLDTIKLTNRFAGPYVRFRQHVRALVERRSPGPLKFREGDFWCETEEDLNALFSQIQDLCRDGREAARGDAAPGATAAPLRGDA